MTPSDDSESERQKARVASGAGFAFLGRMGALIEALSVIVFSWLYGEFIFGLYAVFWGYVKIITGGAELAMTTTLQRFVPQAVGDDTSLIAGAALKTSLIVSTALAATIYFVAPGITHIFNAAPEQAEELGQLVRLYVWILPLWTFVEVATAAVRATRTFGPEIKIRIFYEQGFRLILAVVFALAGNLTYGLFIAHMASVFITALFALRLVSKYYHLPHVLKAPVTGPVWRNMMAYGLSVMPSNLTKKLFSEFPVIFLNILLPGAAGAAAAAFYAVARKIASALQAVRLTFEYVMAPLAAEREGAGDRRALKDMYGFATRLAFSVALPFGAALIWASGDILAVMKPEFAAAYSAIVILITGRVLEAFTGPASAIIEMLGHRLLPALNALAGVITMLLIGFYLIPKMGVEGAAIAAATGLNVTAFLNFLEAGLVFKLYPLSRESVRPYFTAALLALGLSIPSLFAVDLDTPISLFSAIFGLIIALAILLRFGLSESDAAALGKLGKWGRRR